MSTSSPYRRSNPRTLGRFDLTSRSRATTYVAYRLDSARALLPSFRNSAARTKIIRVMGVVTVTKTAIQDLAQRGGACDAGASASV